MQGEHSLKIDGGSCYSSNGEIVSSICMLKGNPILSQLLFMGSCFRSKSLSVRVANENYSNRIDKNQAKS